MKTSTRISRFIKRSILFSLLLLGISEGSKAQITVSGSSLLDGTYTSFTKSGGLFAALNSTSQNSNNIVVSVTADVTTEDGANSLNAGAWTSITITPSGARTISGSTAVNLLNFNGADNVTINGLNTGGNSLTISNTATGASNTIRFINDASNNTITNCVLQGSASTAANAVVNFGAGTTTGNDNNIISNNTIGAAGSNLPINGIYSVGTSASIDNSSNTVSGNNILDYFNAGLLSSGITLAATGNNTWTINNNKFYQTATRVYTTAATHYGIFIGVGDGYTVSGNTIGYANASGTGTYTMTSGAALATRFIGIGITAGTTVASSIQGNTIANIYLASSNTTGTANGSLCGINILGGNVNVGTVTGNTIGATTGTGSLYCYQRASGGGIVGINAGSTGTLVISNNTIGSLTAKDSLATYVTSVYGIINSAAGALTVSNNIIGNSTANNLVAGTLSSTTSASIAGGIFYTTAPTTFDCGGNTVQNIANYGTGTGYTKGIGTTTVTNSTSTVNVYNNTVRNITSYGTLASFTSGHTAVSGIQIGIGLVPRIYNNTISEIVYAGAATTNVIALGIGVAQATTPTIYNNKIYAIRNRGKSVTLTTPCIAAGIAVRSSTTSDSIYNNMVSLGSGDTANVVIVGIWGNHGSTPDPSPLYILHNTVNIEGTQNSGAMPSFCVHRGAFTATAYTVAYVVKNNIFNNTRTGGTTGHFAIGNCFNATGATTGLTCNYNIYNSANTATVGYHAAGAKTFAQWQAAFGDANSYTATAVTFTNTATGDLHINMGTTSNQIESQGDATLVIATDFDGQARPGPVGSVNGGAQAPDLGADEWDGSIVYSCATPAANTVNASVTNVTCFGATTNLTLANAVTGTGNSYQWQLSTDGTNYTNIGGAVANAYIASPASPNNYYRCIITCSNGPASTTTSSVLVTGPAQLAAGTYTINSGVATGGTNYISFTDAFADLSCKGIAGPVVFNVASGSGPYVEQVVLNAVAGASATNTITINGNGRTLSFNSVTSATRSGIILNGADYVTIDNLKIDGSAGTYGWGVLLTGGADYNTISNCIITVSGTSTTSTNHNGIVISGSTTTPSSSGVNGSYNTITGNTINGGYYGIAMYGSSTASLYNTNNTVTNNTVKNTYAYSLYNLYQKNATISGNDISRPDRTATTTVGGVFFSTGGSGSVISKNRIYNMFNAVTGNTSTAYGIYVAADGVSGAENIVSNNIITFTSGLGTGTIYGIYNSGGAYMLAYHNTILISDAASTAGTTYGLYQTTAVAGIQYKNNIVDITRGGTGIKRCAYYSTTTSTIISNNNNFYLNTSGGTDNAIGQWGTTIYLTLNDWKTANSNAYDANSVSVNPLFVDPTNNDFTPNSGAMDNLGVNVGITTDILGNSRDNITPDMGAIEFTGAGCQDPPTPGTATSSVSFACSGVSFNLDVTGNSSGVGQSYQWQFSTDNTNWTDIGTNQSTTSYTTNQTVAHYYRVAITCSGGTTVYSSSVYVNTPSSIIGTYTINKNAAASSTNFQSITSAVNAMGCGITGPVVFNVVAGSGPYNEQITIPAISGASSTNTITFDGNGNTITFNSAITSARTGITLNGADYVTIQNFTIDGAAGTYDWGVLFTNAADYNTVSNCVILCSPTDITSSNHYPVVFSGSVTSPTTSGNNGNYNTITGCTLTGGYYNVSLYGNSTTGAENIGNTFSNNTMTDAYVYSMYVLYQKDLTIRGNNISRPTRTASSTLAGMYLTTSSGGGYLIEKNIIHNMNDLQPTSTSTCYGIFIAADAASFSNANIVRNNLVFNLGGNGPIYGIYNSAGDYNKIYHNTIVHSDADATSGNAYGIYQTGAANVDIKNNNIVVSRKGTGIKRCLYFGTTTSTITCDYNNLLMNAASGTDNNVGQFGTSGTFNFATLADWKTANSSAFDQNSYSVSPSFVDITNNIYKPAATVLNDKGIYVGVLKDILDSTRSNTTPDIGAYEFDIPTCTGTPVAGTVSVSATTICSGNNLTLDASGNSIGLGITYQWQSSSNNTTWTDFGASRESVLFDTTQTATKYYRLAVTCNSNTTSYSTSVLVTTPALVSGSFTIDAGSPTSGTNFVNFADAISYISCGINGPVVFNVVSGSGPYNEQITIPVINGASATNTITFNGNGNTVSFNATITSARAVFTLNGADYITLNNLNINGSGGTYGWGVFMTNQADNNTISNCTIDAGANATTTNFAAVVMSASYTSATTTGTVGSNNIITDNTIIGGYYGVVACGGSANLGMNNQITNNLLIDQYLYPSYNTYQSGALISNNDIYKLNRTTFSTGYGCYLTTGVTNSTFQKNKIHNIFGTATTSTSTFYGFYVAGDGTIGNENKIINNLIYDINNNGANYGVYNTTGAYMKVYHNTIVFDGTATTTGTTYGVYQTGSVVGIDIRNNNIYITRSGTGIKRCLHFVTTTSSIISNNNNLYLSATAGTDNNIGTFGTTAYATLTNWKTANGNVFDQNSISVNPSFVSPASGNYRPTTQSVNTVGANIGVSDDILGAIRAANYTAGCYQNDGTAPSISYTALTEDCGPSQTSSRVLSGVVITDATGIPTSGGNVPRIYYKKGTSGTWGSNAGNLTSGSSINGNWSFTINYASIPGLANGDSIYYFVVAQDLATTANVSSIPSGISATSVNSLSVYPTGNYFRAITYTPSITINTAITTVCSGSNTTFTSSITNGGSSPSYQWTRNGFSAGSGSSITFPSGSLTNGDVIGCSLTANNTCQTNSTVNSNLIQLTVKPSPAVAPINTGTASITTVSMCTLGKATAYFSTTPYGTWSSSNPAVASVTGGSQSGLVTPNSNGTAIISYGVASTNGCVSTSTLTVIVDQQTQPTAITGTNSICVNATTALSSTAPIGTTGVWSSSNDRGTINSIGVYTGKNAGTWGEARFTVTSTTTGCTAFAAYAITVNPTPVVPTITYAPGTPNPQLGAPTGGFCVGKKFRLVATPNVPAGVWTATGAASILSPDTVSINGVGAGTIKYTYTSAAGCSNSRTMSGNGYACAARGINNTQLTMTNNEWTMYPNPATMFISLNIETLVGKGSIVVTNLYGKELKVQALSMGTNIVDIANLSKGVYFVSTITSEGKSTKKLIVE